MIRRWKSSRGFSVLEFVLAMTLLLAVFTASAQVLSSTSRALVEGRARDSASLIGYRVLEKSRVLGCGYGVELAAPALATDPVVMTTNELAARCGTQVFAGAPAAADTDFTLTESEREFDVRFRTSWGYVSGTSLVDCAPVVAPPATSFDQPTVLVRTALVDWSVRDVPRPSVVTETVETVLPESPRVVAGSGQTSLVAVKAPVGKRVTLSTTRSGVTHTALRYSNSSGCALFPYLPAGAYQVSIENGVSESFTLSDPTIRRVPQ